MSKTNLYIAASVAGMTGALFGYSVGFVGGVIVLPSFLRHFDLDTLPSSDLARSRSIIVSSWIIGAFFGVPAGIPICSRYGRKRCLMFSAALYVLGAVLQVINSGSSLGMFIAGRLLNGFGVGSGTLVSPMYISEVSTPSDRGMLVSSYQVVIQGCALIGFWGAYAANAAIPDSSDWQWQIPVAVQLIPGALLLLGTFFIKETPHYIAATRSMTELEINLSWFRGLPAADQAIQQEAKEISTTVQSGIRRQEIRKTSFVREAFSKPIRKRLAVGVGLFVSQNMSGMNALNYYVPVIFMKAGFTTVSSSLFLTGIFGAVKVVAAILFMFVCVRIYGNRFWLIWGTAVCVICMAILGYCVATMAPSTESSSPSARAIISVVSVYVYALAFGVSMGPIAWNVCAEIFPSHINAQCCAVTTCTQWLFQIIIAAITPILLNAIGPMTFIFYAVCNLAGLVFYYTSVPETRGVALGRDMAKVFGVDAKDEEFGQGEVEEVEDVDEIDEITPLLVADHRRRRRSSVAIVV